MVTTAIENGKKAENPVTVLRGLLERASGEIAKALPRHLTPERMIRAAVTAYNVTPALQECSALSIVGCVIQASQLGLELSGPLGQAYMVPFKNKNTGGKEAQFVVGYRGLIRLAYNSGLVSYFAAHEVHEKDTFDYQYGTDQYLRHKPPVGGDRGKVVAYYAVVRLKDGGSEFEVMTVADCQTHRAKYAKSDKFWGPAFDEMAKKTVIRRLAKRCPMSLEMATVAADDESWEQERLQAARPEVSSGLSRSEVLAMALTQQGEAEEEPLHAGTPLPAGAPTDATLDEIAGVPPE